MPTALVVIAMCIVAIAAGQLVLTRRTRRLKRSRAGEDYRTFVKHFADADISEAIIQSVYRYLQEWIGDDQFPVRPSDVIGRDYGIVNDDLIDLINHVVAAHGVQPPASNEIRRIRTVRDLIELLGR